MDTSPERALSEPVPAWVDDANVALLTDLYELTMSAAYHASGASESVATFELFVRRLPERRNFLVAAGLEQALAYLETATFDADAIDYLRSLRMFDDAFLRRLRAFRFSGDVWAVPEGEVVFAGEPLLTVSAPLLEAQLVETFLLNAVLFQTMVASKAARVALACRSGAGAPPFADFSARRDHGADAAVKAARATYIGGASSTSNVLAGSLFGIPLSGTMAHAYVMTFEREVDAFRCFLRTFPNQAVLLIDTYDTDEGARRAVAVAHELADEGVRLQGVRIDSGDLASVAVRVRRILDDGGLGDARIVASGDLDEYRIAELLDGGAPIDSFGVGTRLGTSADEPALGGVYKLVEDAAGPKMKRSPGKLTLPGRKQVHRFVDGSGRVTHDVMSLRDEDVPGGRPLLRPVMTAGHVVHHEPLVAMRDRALASIGSLADVLLRLDERHDFRVEHSPGLHALAEATEASSTG